MFYRFKDTAAYSWTGSDLVEVFRWTGDRHQTDDPPWFLNNMRINSLKVATTVVAIDGHDATMAIVTDAQERVFLLSGWYVARTRNGEVFALDPDALAAHFVPAPGEVGWVDLARDATPPRGRSTGPFGGSPDDAAPVPPDHAE